MSLRDKSEGRWERLHDSSELLGSVVFCVLTKHVRLSLNQINYKQFITFTAKTQLRVLKKKIVA